MWGVRQGQWFKSPKGSFTHIYTNYAKVEILFVKKKKIKKNGICKQNKTLILQHWLLKIEPNEAIEGSPIARIIEIVQQSEQTI